MADGIAVIVRFNGDPDDLIERFERARQLWIEAQGGDYQRPAFYASCKTDDGIAVIDGWEPKPPTTLSVTGWDPTSMRWA